MWKYILHRTILMMPTLFGITLVCFLIINLAPGGPVEQALSQARFSGLPSMGSAGVSNEVMESIKKQYGFDKPVLTRYWIWIRNIARLDFGESVSYQREALTVIVEKIPVSLQFGVASLILTYLISVPLGIAKAVRDGSNFDVWSSFVLMVAHSVPPLILGVLLRVYFSSGQFLTWFPLGDLMSDNYVELSTAGKIFDRVHHFVLPLVCYVLGNFLVLTLMMKNSLIDEIGLDYVRTARAKGLRENAVIFRHALRNALIPIMTGIGGFLSVFFAGSIIIEQHFNIDGMGLLSLNSLMSRDYNVIMALIFIQAILSLLGRLISDLSYVFVDPRIDFE
jgi:microcin C transport system permease protein